MNKQRFWTRALGAVSIVALVLVTNEGYRQVRGLVDTVNQSKRDIALLKRDLYVLQVQLDNGAVPANAPAAVAAPIAMSAPAPAPVALPMPAPIGQRLALPDTPALPRPKPQSNDELKSMVNVVLMSDAKAVASTSSASTTAKPADGSKMDVRLVGDAK